MLQALNELGIKNLTPKATFYLWADVSELPPPLNNGVIFFEHCIRFKVSAAPWVSDSCHPHPADLPPFVKGDRGAWHLL